MSAAAFERYVAPARARAGLLRTFIGLVLILFGWLIWTTLVLVAWVAPDYAAGVPIMEAIRRLGDDFLSGRPAAIAMTLATFIGIWPSVWLVVRFVHGRRLATLLAPEGRDRGGDLMLGFGLAALFWLVGSLLAFALVGLPERSGLSPTNWALWLVPLAVLIFVQAGGEELIFRGYLLQNLAARGHGPWAWAVLPTLIFAVLHYDPDRGSGMNLLYVGTVMIFGLIAAMLVWRTGALWSAIGLHAGNNFGALTLVGVEGITTGSQLFVHGQALKDELILIDMGLMTLMLVWLMSPACPRRLRAA